MSTLDPQTAALVRLAAAIAGGDADRVALRSREAVAVGMPIGWGDELLLQSRLMIGYPRTLSGAQRWREVVGGRTATTEAITDGRQQVERGEATCRAVYGDNYPKLRDNLRRLHPLLDAWMVSEGYGGTLARPGLDLLRRELCVIAQLTILGKGAEQQLHSHLKGALNVGADGDQIDRLFAALAAEVEPAALAAARALWDRLR
jgi:4-carboxymuconolactone decarboxylase